MPSTVAELEQQRARLLEALENNLTYVRDANGEAVSYKSTTDVNRALQAVEQRISKLKRKRNPINPIFSRGI